MKLGTILLVAAVAVAGCKKDAAPVPATTQPARLKIGLVSDVGGRGDQSSNDSAIRGLEQWAAGVAYSPSGYTPLADEAFKASVPDDVRAQGDLPHLEVEPVVLQAKSQEDYQPEL